MPLGLFADHEAQQRYAADAGQRDHGGRDRIGADRHAADRLGAVGRKQVENALADQPRAGRVERDLLAVEIEAGLLARGQREVAKLQGLGANQIDERLFVVHGW